MRHNRVVLVIICFGILGAIANPLQDGQQITESSIRSNKPAGPVDTEGENEDDIGPTEYLPGGIYASNVAQLEAVGIDTKRIDPVIIAESFMSVPELISSHGYSVETHEVRTSDGYILQMHRITRSPRTPNTIRKQPVFLMHGLLDSSSTWVIMGTRNGLGYLLADLGYDVWMGNARGNRHSRRHTRWDPDGWRTNRKNFWDFSWHEVGTIDLPNMIDYVLEHTGFQKLQYIGHSQGTTAFFVMASELPAYNRKIISMQALAPVAFMSNLRSPFVRLATAFLNTIDATTKFFGMYEFMPSSELLALGAQAGCNDGSVFQSLCSNVLYLIAGFNSVQLNATRIPVIASHAPAGASSNNLVHYGQLIRSGKFRQFDHGTIANLVTYGSIHPPSYDLSKISAPVALHYSTNDWLAAVEDVEELNQKLGNVIGKFLVSDQRFNHLDFVWGNDVDTLLYNRVFNLMNLAERNELP